MFDQTACHERIRSSCDEAQGNIKKQSHIVHGDAHQRFNDVTNTSNSADTTQVTEIADRILEEDELYSTLANSEPADNHEVLEKLGWYPYAAKAVAHEFDEGSANHNVESICGRKTSDEENVNWADKKYNLTQRIQDVKNIKFKNSEEEIEFCQAVYDAMEGLATTSVMIKFKALEEAATEAERQSQESEDNIKAALKDVNDELDVATQQIIDQNGVIAKEMLEKDITSAKRAKSHDELDTVKAHIEVNALYGFEWATNKSSPMWTDYKDAREEVFYDDLEQATKDTFEATEEKMEQYYQDEDVPVPSKLSGYIEFAKQFLWK